MESLSEAPEHDERLGWEGPGSDCAVRALIASRRTLAAEAPTRKLPTRPAITTHPWNTVALAPVKLTSVTWELKMKRCHDFNLRFHTCLHSSKSHNDTGGGKIGESDERSGRGSTNKPGS